VTSGANDCCQNVSSPVEILIHTVPSSIIDAGPDTTINSVFYSYQMKAAPPASENGETGLWETLSGSTDISDITKYDTKVYNLESKNVYSWTVTNGPCINKDTVTIIVKSYVIPNGFSPNNDGVNDYFEILGLDIYTQEVELIIVNSAGTEVFKTTNKNGTENWVNWDGRNSGGVTLPEGTYYYILNMKSKDEPDKPPTKETGYVVLKRY
jgi:gliding motility-associated-like protein